MNIYSYSIKRLSVLVVMVAVLCGYNFMSAQTWTDAPANPPNTNATAPVNIGGTYQAKAGDLGVVQMRAGRYCNAAGTVCATVDEMLADTSATASNQIVYLSTPYDIPSGLGNYTLDLVALGYPANITKVYLSGTARGGRSGSPNYNEYSGDVTYTVPGVPSSTLTLVSAGYNQTLTNQAWILLGTPKTVNMTFNYFTGNSPGYANASVLG